MKFVTVLEILVRLEDGGGYIKVGKVLAMYWDRGGHIWPDCKRAEIS